MSAVPALFVYKNVEKSLKALSDVGIAEETAAAGFRRSSRRCARGLARATFIQCTYDQLTQDLASCGYRVPAP